MDELERGRRRLFWLYKKWSSYSIWEHYAKAFDTFVKEYETAVGTWPVGEAPPEYNLHAAYEAQEFYPKGLAELKKGNRSVWRNRDDGYLVRAAGRASYAMQGITSDEINQLMGGEKGTPYFAEWTPRLEQLRIIKQQATLGGGMLIYEPQARYSDMKAVARKSPHGDEINAYIDNNIDKFGSTPHAGHQIPTPSDVVISSGKKIPFDGVWEFVDADSTPGKTDSINYFIRGALAPWIVDFSKGFVPGKQFTLPARWRLVWKDERYLDGIIPDESEYFADYSQSTASTEAPVEMAQSTALRAEGGQPCPRTGYWYTLAKSDSRQRFVEGEILPIFAASSYGSTIWYWHVDQSSK